MHALSMFFADRDGDVVMIVVKVTILVLLVAIASKCLRRLSAGRRHVLWYVALGSAVMLRVLGAIVPNFDVAVSSRSAIGELLSVAPTAEIGVQSIGAMTDTVHLTLRHQTRLEAG